MQTSYSQYTPAMSCRWRNFYTPRSPSCGNSSRSTSVVSALSRRCQASAVSPGLRGASSTARVPDWHNHQSPTYILRSAPCRTRRSRSFRQSPRDLSSLLSCRTTGSSLCIRRSVSRPRDGRTGCKASPAPRSRGTPQCSASASCRRSCSPAPSFSPWLASPTRCAW